MRGRPRALVLLSCAAFACGGGSPAPQPIAEQAKSAPPAARSAAASARASGPATPDLAAKSTPSGDPDGNDDELDSSAVLPAQLGFVKVGRHAAALSRICDFAVLGGALYMTHATQPLGLGGATITRYEPNATPEFSLSFDWNRPGEPEKGGAGGQGFLRARRIGARLWVPDADPPYLGLGLKKTMAEGYVFVSDQSGRFERARRPGQLPPKAPTSDRGGAAILPGALHVFDAIRYREKIYVSTGAVVPGMAGKSPGTLYAGSEPSSDFEVAYTYPGAARETSARLGYMVRFRGRLYVAISPLEGRDHNDYVVIEPPSGTTTFGQEHARAVSVLGGAHTLRWYVDHKTLYWIAIGSGGTVLAKSEDGDHWTPLALPAEAGRPTDVLRVGKRLLVLAERALVELGAKGAALLAVVEDKKSPFTLDDAYCAAPLAVFAGELYAGAQKKGALYKLAAAQR